MAVALDMIPLSSCENFCFTAFILTPVKGSPSTAGLVDRLLPDGSAQNTGLHLSLDCLSDCELMAYGGIECAWISLRRDG